MNPTGSGQFVICDHLKREPATGSALFFVFRLGVGGDMVSESITIQV